MLKPRGGKDAVNPSQYLGVLLGVLPRYALTWYFLMFKEALNIGSSCDSISLPFESRTINSLEETCSIL